MSGGLVRKDYHNHHESLFPSLWEERRDVFPSLNPNECGPQGWQGDFIVLWIERRGPYTRFLGLKYLFSTASKKVTHSGSNSCEVDPSGPVVGAQEEAELEPCRPHWGMCNREGGLTRHNTHKNLDACHTKNINYLPGQPEKQHSQQDTIKVKKCLLCSHHHSSSASLIEGALPSISRETESFESTLKF